jgi:hypothetical protein
MTRINNYLWCYALAAQLIPKLIHL